MYKIVKTSIDSCIEMIPNIFNDDRGNIIKTYHYPTFRDIGIDEIFNEDLISISKKGVIRGLHFQKKPFEQSKLVYCISGSILDVAVDIRAESSTYGKYVCFNLDSKKRNMAYIPSGFAHGYEALEDNTVVIYKLSSPYMPAMEGGIKWNSIDIPWRGLNQIISEKDSRLPSFKEYTDELK